MQSGRINKQRNGKDEGFVLLTVLLITAVISALATAALVTARSHSRAIAGEISLIRAGALTEAGLVRILSALEQGDNTLIEMLRDRGESVVWNYAGVDVTLSLSKEAGKVDLNTGDPALVRSVLRALVKDAEKQSEILQRWETRRRKGQAIESVDALLPPQDQMGPLAQSMERALTTVSAAVGIDPLAAPEIVLKSVPGFSESDYAVLRDARRLGNVVELQAIKARLRPLLDGERPLYRLRASAVLDDGTKTSRSALVTQDMTTGTVSVSQWNSL